MSNIDKQALTDEAISKAFAGTNFGRDDFKNILAETVIDAAAGWRCGYTATTICTQLGLLTPKGCASALGLRFISEHVQRETKRLKDELEAAEKRIAELGAREVNLPKLSVGEVMHMSGFSRDYAEGWCSGNDNAIHEIHAAGVKVAAAVGKGEAS
ncbi:ead/Ea22-like family protein [Enterobacter bugandensis]|uniref:ead/Ea22-like family protein n=1 Tax=Enterobacter bugandensis TaxID=881260 RepID=UPI001F19DCCD|nr:ead/Ea22-like family protein [Enterobacter bugandensis]